MQHINISTNFRDIIVRTNYQIIIAILCVVVLPKTLIAKIHIFACEPEWAALSEEIGGDKVSVFSATSAKQDPHYIRAKPSLIARMRKSDLLIGSGGGLEIGWLPVLLKKSGNASIQPGKPGYLMAAEVVSLIERPETVDRSHGDVHPEGNPHRHLHPDNIIAVAKELSERLAEIDNDSEAYYRSRCVIFLEEWTDATAKWALSATALKGMPVVVHHTSFAYLENWLGLKRILTLEPKPGLPPTAAHLESSLKLLRSNPGRVILRSPYDLEKASLWLSKKTDIPAIELPYTVGGCDDCDDLYSLYDRTLALLNKAYNGEL